MNAQNYDMEALRDAIRNMKHSDFISLLDMATQEWLEDTERNLKERREELLETDNGIESRANDIAEETDRGLDEVRSELIAETMKELEEAGEFEKGVLELFLHSDEEEILNGFADEEFLEQFRK